MSREYDVSWFAQGDGSGSVRFRADGASPSVLEVVIQRGDGHAVLFVDDLAPLGGGPIEIRDSGVWFELIELEPRRQLQIGLEAFGVTVDELPQRLADLRGIPAALGLDLEVYVDADGTHAIGEVLVDEARIAIDGHASWR